MPSVKIATSSIAPDRSSRTTFSAASASVKKLVMLAYSPCCGQQTTGYRSVSSRRDSTIAPSPIWKYTARSLQTTAASNVQARSCTLTLSSCDQPNASRRNLTIQSAMKLSAKTERASPPSMRDLTSAMNISQANVEPSWANAALPAPSEATAMSASAPPASTTTSTRLASWHGVEDLR